jgi:hypothetical protein
LSSTVAFRCSFSMSPRATCRCKSDGDGFPLRMGDKTIQSTESKIQALQFPGLAESWEAKPSRMSRGSALQFNGRRSAQARATAHEPQPAHRSRTRRPRADAPQGSPYFRDMRAERFDPSSRPFLTPSCLWTCQCAPLDCFHRFSGPVRRLLEPRPPQRFRRSWSRCLRARG